jgi:tetratricopeptide (TPR) repeat protein
MLLHESLGARRQLNEIGPENGQSNTVARMCVKRCWKKSLSIITSGRWAFAFLISLVASIPICGQVRVWEGVLDLPTYEEGAPAPNPPFDQFATGRFNYPYTLRNEITNTPVEHQWRAVYLENEYLKCSVLPDVGGHIYTCIDKINGQPMFYANPSLKKARIGYRGAWAAFGVEFNFPVSHNWVSMSPVDFAYAQHQDGSASVTVGNIDRVYGMEWTVELTLRPGSTILEQHTTLSNRSDVRHRFYWWNNAGVQVWDDSRIQYPQRFAAAHGFAEVQRWPVDAQGKDLSVIRNQTDGPVSLFTHGSREDFMGVWNPHSNTGTAHFSEYLEVPAKKIWSWGVDADGLDWRKALSDNDSAYVELQAGLFRNQETYAFLEPRQAISFTEYWMPVRDTGGISRANLAGAVHLQRNNGILSVAFNANRKIPGATITILNEANPTSLNKTSPTSLNETTSLLEEKADLAPERVWKNEIAIPSAARNLTFELKSNEGAVLLRQTEGQYDWMPESEIKLGAQASYKIPEESRRTADDWLQLGKNEELNGNVLAAVQTYEKALQKFPSSFELIKALGRLDARLYRFDESLSRLVAVHDRNTSDPEISYYLGIAYEGLNREEDAADAYREAMRLPDFRAAAAMRLAEVQARAGRLDRAQELLTQSSQFAPEDLRAAEELVAVLSALRKTGEAETLAKERLARFPLSDFLREELGSPNLAHLSGDPYRVLNIAYEYARLGLYRRAVSVLSREYPPAKADQSEPGSVLPQNHPLVVYFRGYCRERLGEDAQNDYMQASRLSTLYIFPNRIEDLRALRAAIRINAKDASAHYLLGTWHFARGQTDAALSEWKRAQELNPKMPVLQASTGLALLHVKHEFAAALNAFEEGIKNDPLNPVNYSGALAAMTLLGRAAAERARMLERYPTLSRMPTPLVYELALNRAEEGNYDAALDLFRNRFFGREEGGTNVRQVWIEVNLQRALKLAQENRCRDALAVAKSLGSPVQDLAFTQDGLLPFLNSARSSFLLGEVSSTCGQKKEADESYSLSAQASGPTDIVWAWASARKLNGYDPVRWRARLKATLSQAESNVETGNSSGWWLYTAGVLQMALGNIEKGKALLHEALLVPETRMSYHLSRLALAGATPQN